jgi:SAM-dependent methyltransferase
MSSLSSSVGSRPFNLRRSLGTLAKSIELRWALATDGTDSLLRRRFNRWAKQGRGESMEQHHTPIAEAMWDRMELGPQDRILELGCGEGWACRLMAERAGRGCSVVGIDISNEMIGRAWDKSRSLANVSYHCGSADQIPGPDAYFTKVVSIEAFYYFERQEQVLRELRRVMKPGGQLYLLMCLYRDDPKAQSWFEDVGLPVHNRSVIEYEDMLRRAGWVAVESEVFEFRTDPFGKRDAHDRPLLVTARRPC